MGYYVLYTVILMLYWVYLCICCCLYYNLLNLCFKSSELLFNLRSVGPHQNYIIIYIHYTLCQIFSHIFVPITYNSKVVIRNCRLQSTHLFWCVKKGILSSAIWFYSFKSCSKCLMHQKPNFKHHVWRMFVNMEKRIIYPQAISSCRVYK